MNTLNQFFFGIYPYIALTVFLLGSLVRFEREQYTWKTDSSQLLHTAACGWATSCSTSASWACSSATPSAC